MRMRWVLLCVTAVAVVGCGSQTRSSTSVDAGRPYELYTHCGIEWARIDGTFWRATRPLSDGSGNPPAGWGNPAQAGRLVFLGPTRARFESPAGVVTFNRTSRRRPPRLCA